MARRANLKAGSGREHAVEGQKLPHCVPHGGSVLPRNDTFLCFSYIFLVPATRVVCDHEAVNRAQGEKEAGDA
jgi:hypothetical protein